MQHGKPRLCPAPDVKHAIFNSSARSVANRSSSGQAARSRQFKQATTGAHACPAETVTAAATTSCKCSLRIAPGSTSFVIRSFISAEAAASASSVLRVRKTYEPQWVCLPLPVQHALGIAHACSALDTRTECASAAASSRQRRAQPLSGSRRRAATPCRRLRVQVQDSDCCCRTCGRQSACVLLCIGSSARTLRREQQNLAFSRLTRSTRFPLPLSGRRVSRVAVWSRPGQGP
jgi:hypothetical protein